MAISLLKGDCLDVMRTLPDKSISCFVCDLPYGCLEPQRIKTAEAMKKTKQMKVSGCAWDIKLDLNLFWEQVKRLAKDDHTPVLMFCNTKFGADLINSNPKWFRYDLVWNKMRGVSFLSANKMPMKSHELIYVFSKKGAYYKRIDIEGEYNAQTHKGNGEEYGGVYGKKKDVSHHTTATHRCPLSIVNVQTRVGKSNHPTSKPAELYKWLLERYCPEGGTMLDPTAGSFNSCFTAKEMGLKAIGIEKDSGFFWKAVSRL
jgi:site-specific DNA-methyltransferase (adenine-specific)